MFMRCKDCDSIEIALIEKFKRIFEPMKSIGSEYFEGDIMQMIDVASSYINTVNKNRNNCKRDKNMIYTCAKCDKQYTTTRKEMHRSRYHDLSKVLEDICIARKS